MALLPYNYASDTDEEQQQNNAQSQAATSAGPAPYQPPQTSSSAGATAPGAQNQQAQSQIQQAAQAGSPPPTQPPQTFSTMESAGQARPPAPSYAMSPSSPTPTGQTGTQVQPALVDSSLQSRTDPNSVAAGFGTDINGYSTMGDINQNTPQGQQLTSFLNSIAGDNNTFQQLQKVIQSGQQFTPEQQAQWDAAYADDNAKTAASPYAGALSATPSASQATTTGQYVTDPTTGMSHLLDSSYNFQNAPPPGSTPSYLQGGMTVGANGQPIQGGYNALQDYYNQEGTTPGTYNSTVANLLQQNPNLASGMTPQQQQMLQGAQLSSMGLPPGTNPILAQALTGYGGANTNLTPSGGASTPGFPSVGGIAPPVGGVNPSPSSPAPYTAAPAPGSPTPTPVGTGPQLVPTGNNQGVGSNFSIPGALESGAQGQGPASQVQGATQQAAMNLLNNPDPYNQQTVQNAYNWLSGNIQDQYTQAQQALGQQMAARGLGSSSIYGGQLGDLNIAQRSAQEALGENLAQNLAQSQGQYEMGALGLGNQVGNAEQSNQQNYLAQLMGYGQNAFQNSLESQMANQQQQQAYQQYVLGLLGLSYQNPNVG